jgi:hypothetical protein
LLNFSWKRTWPLALACAIFLLAIAVHLEAVLKLTHGEQLFVLDDPYIHASIAKNLLVYHTFGISPNVFSSASSSILWPFLVAGLFSVFGLHVWILLAFNVVLGLIALWLYRAVWRSLVPEAPAILEFISLLAIVMAGSLVSLVFLGMEHILQCITVMSLLFATVAVANVRGPEKISPGLLFWLYLSGIVAVMTRFEGAFAVCVACSFLFLRGRRSLAVLASIVSALPILFFGWYSVRHGAAFFPNSLLLKAVHGRGKLSGLQNLVGHYSRYHGFLWIWLLTCGELALCYRFLKKPWSRQSVQLTLLVVLLTVLHCLFGAVGWAYRYEAYLVAMCLLSCGFLAAELLEEYARAVPAPQAARNALGVAIPALLLLLIMCTAARIDQTQSVINKGAENVYDQQLQIARFLEEYYPHETVAVNDVGAVSYLRSSPVLDLYGLASNQVARLTMEGRWNTASMDAETQKAGVRVAVVYNGWFRGAERLPSSWVEVATWTLPNPEGEVIWGLRLPPPEVVVGSVAVAFYATNAATASQLAANLRSFSPCVPPAVLQSLQGEVLHGGGACAINVAALDQPQLRTDSARSLLMKK